MLKLVELFLVSLVLTVGLSQTSNIENDVSFNLGNGLVDKASKIMDKLSNIAENVVIKHSFGEFLPLGVQDTLDQITEYYTEQIKHANETNKWAVPCFIIIIILLCLLILLIIVSMVCCCVVTWIYAITQRQKHKKKNVSPPSTVVVSQPQPYQQHIPPSTAQSFSPNFVNPMSHPTPLTSSSPTQTTPSHTSNSLPKPTLPDSDFEVQKLAKNSDINEKHLSNVVQEINIQKPVKPSEPISNKKTKDIGLQTEPKKKENNDMDSEHPADKNRPPFPLPLLDLKEINGNLKVEEHEDKSKEKETTPMQTKSCIIDKSVQTDLDSSDNEKYSEKIRANETFPGRNKKGPRTELVV